MRPEQNGWHCAGDIFKSIFLDEYSCIMTLPVLCRYWWHHRLSLMTTYGATSCHHDDFGFSVNAPSVTYHILTSFARTLVTWVHFRHRSRHTQRSSTVCWVPARSPCPRTSARYTSHGQGSHSYHPILPARMQPRKKNRKWNETQRTRFYNDVIMTAKPRRDVVLTS